MDCLIYFKIQIELITNINQIAFSKFLEEVDTGRVVQVTIQGNNINGTLSDGSKFKTYSPNYPDLVAKLSERNVSINASPVEDKMPSLLGVLLSWFPMLLINWSMDIFYASNARRKRRPWVLENQKQNY